mmetsp:Transcript_23340/g.54264  ORF Transcript_23340/g.54264 Transcript_23340/m.54264 type:complete len:303 (+) Transcript_23340:64-972(+)
MALKKVQRELLEVQEAGWVVTEEEEVKAGFCASWLAKTGDGATLRISFPRDYPFKAFEMERIDGAQVHVPPHILSSKLWSPAYSVARFWSASRLVSDPLGMSWEDLACIPEEGCTVYLGVGVGVMAASSVLEMVPVELQEAYGDGRPCMIVLVDPLLCKSSGGGFMFVPEQRVVHGDNFTLVFEQRALLKHEMGDVVSFCQRVVKQTGQAMYVKDMRGHHFGGIPSALHWCLERHQELGPQMIREASVFNDRERGWQPRAECVPLLQTVLDNVLGRPATQDDFTGTLLRDYSVTGYHPKSTV